MKKIIYSALTPEGKEKTGFIEAINNKDALRSLKSSGLSEITLYDDELTAFKRDDLNGLNEKELARIAQFEIKARSHTSLASCLLETVKINWLLITISSIASIWAFISASILIMSISLIIALSPLIFTTWKYRAVTGYNNLLRACSIGAWTDVIKYIRQLKKHMNQPEMAFDLDIREATVLASQGKLDKAFELVEIWKTEFEQTNPGFYESRVSTLYHASGDYLSFLETMKKAYTKSTSSSVMTLDVALAEARFGDIENAVSLLETIQVDELPPYASPYIHWTKGIIAKRKHESNAVDLLAKAVSQFLEYGDNPAVIVSLALCSGTFASVLLSNGDRLNATRVIEKVYDVLKVHADKPLLKELSPILET